MFVDYWTSWLRQIDDSSIALWWVGHCLRRIRFGVELQFYERAFKRRWHDVQWFSTWVVLQIHRYGTGKDNWKAYKNSKVDSNQGIANYDDQVIQKYLSLIYEFLVNRNSCTLFYRRLCPICRHFWFFHFHKLTPYGNWAQIDCFPTRF